MVDISEEFGSGGWGLVRRKVLRGEDPDLAELAMKLRSGTPPPPEVCEYIAGLLDKSIKRKRGPKPARLSVKTLRQWSLAHRVKRWQYVFQNRCGDTDAYRAALDKVSEEFNVPTGTLDNWVYPRK